MLCKCFFAPSLPFDTLCVHSTTDSVLRTKSDTVLKPFLKTPFIVLNLINKWSFSIYSTDVILVIMPVTKRTAPQWMMRPHSKKVSVLCIPPTAQKD